ncbi:hypothetical protein [Devosia sp.]|uniref:hypothetical protein n=1 Tax=Devosia sp. TaxID=1871048 RepID=UPI001B193F14|nr:hypothetical protein [Devosia sp.]MBO9589061.1 hypothetical protein [Devosia sp.]
MALPDTLGRDQFADLLRTADIKLVQAFQQQRSMTGGGETRYADRAPSLYRADIRLATMENAEAEGIMALINSRGGGLKTVLLFNSRMPFPASDPDGSIIGATVPKLGAITDRLHVAFTGFPAGYVLPRGMFFGIVFDTSRHYLGQIVEPKVASGAGAVTATEIWPPLPASIAGTPDVVVAKPVGKFRIEPGSAFAPSVDQVNATVQFTAEQTYSR